MGHKFLKYSFSLIKVKIQSGRQFCKVLKKMTMLKEYSDINNLIN